MDFCRVVFFFLLRSKRYPFLLCASEAQRKERNGAMRFSAKRKIAAGDGAFWKTAKRSDKTRAAKY